MTDHAERLNEMMGDMFDTCDKSTGPVAGEDIFEVLITSMVSILSSIEPRELRRERIKIYQKALEVADSDEDDNGSGVLQ